MNNLITGLIFSLTLFPSNNIDNCSELNTFHPVRSDIMLQVVLKSYGYYEGKIDGQFGTLSKNALIKFQSNNNIDADGIVGTEICNLFLDKNSIIKNNSSKANNVDVQVKNSNQNYLNEQKNNPFISIGTNLFTHSYRQICCLVCRCDDFFDRNRGFLSLCFEHWNHFLTRNDHLSSRVSLFIVCSLRTGRRRARSRRYLLS